MLGARLRKVRLERDITLTQAARGLGIAHSTLSSYEAGRRQLDPEMLKKIALLYQVSADYLLGLSENEKLAALSQDQLPENLRHVGVEYLAIAKELENKSIPPEDLKRFVAMLRSYKN